LIDRIGWPRAHPLLSGMARRVAAAAQPGAIAAKGEGRAPQNLPIRKPDLRGVSIGLLVVEAAESRGRASRQVAR